MLFADTLHANWHDSWMTSSSWQQILEDWRYIAMVIDRLQLYVFLVVTVTGTAAILIHAPHIFEFVDQDELKLRIMGSAEDFIWPDDHQLNSTQLKRLLLSVNAVVVVEEEKLKSDSPKLTKALTTGIPYT